MRAKIVGDAFICDCATYAHASQATATTGLSYLGLSTNSWADAKTDAENETTFPAVSWPDGGTHLAASFTLGARYDDTNGVAVAWLAWAYVAQSQMKASPTIFARTNMFTADLYTKCSVATESTKHFSGFADNPTNWVDTLDVDDHSWMLSTNQYYGLSDAATTPGTSSNIFMGIDKDGGVYLGSTNFPEWCDAPSADGTGAAKGYSIGDDDTGGAAPSLWYVLKFDVTTNGFNYIRDN